MREQKGQNKILLLYNSDAVRKNYIPKKNENEHHLSVEINFSKIRL